MQPGPTGSLTPDNFNTFGDLLKYLREKAELSQREMAQQVGYHYSYMSRIEKGERTPDTATLMARFVPVLGLENEPGWTERLLTLASSKYKMIVPRKSGQTVVRSALPGATIPTIDSPYKPLPVVLTPLLGRENDIETINNLMARSEVRLLTLVGAPGVGKTRIAIYLANELAGQFAHGSAFVDLSPINNTGGVLSALANALGIQGTSEATLISQIINHVKQKNLLLVIDNFEHVIEAAPEIVQVLGNALLVKMIVTSREALRVSGEFEFNVKPLEIPQSGQESVDQIMDSPVVQLFTQRAKAVDPGFELTNDNLKPILEICSRLDGLPLAIELAAARIKFLTPQTMLAQFERHLDWAAHSSRDSISSRQTLRGAVEWSYNTLSEQEKILMRRLSVFSGGWNAGLAEVICSDDDADPDPQLKRADILNTLIQLSDKSLVLAEKQEHETRFRFLETIHEFAIEKLEASGEAVKIRNRLLSYFADFAETMEAGIDGKDQIKWMRLGYVEHNNLRAAIDWGLNKDANFHDAMRTITGTSVFWTSRSSFREGFERIDTYLQHPASREFPALRVKLLYRVGFMAGYLFDLEPALAYGHEAVELARSLGSKKDQANASFYLSEVLYNSGKMDEARASLEESIALSRELNYSTQLNVTLTSLGMLQLREGEIQSALVTLDQALEIASRDEDTWGLAYALQHLGMAHRVNGTYEEAISFLERSYEVNETIGHRHAQGVVLGHLSALYNIKQDYKKSDSCAEQAFAIFQDVGDAEQQPVLLRMMGYAAIQAGNLVRARALMRESLAGAYTFEDLPGQMGCFIGIAACDSSDGNFANAVKLCALAQKTIETNGLILSEPDQLAFESVHKQGIQKLKKSGFEASQKDALKLNLENVLQDLMA